MALRNKLEINACEIFSDGIGVWAVHVWFNNELKQTLHGVEKNQNKLLYIAISESIKYSEKAGLLGPRTVTTINFKNAEDGYTGVYDLARKLLEKEHETL